MEETKMARSFTETEKDNICKKLNLKMSNEKAEIIPTTQHILDSYDKLTIVENNDLSTYVPFYVIIMATLLNISSSTSLTL